MIRVNNISYSYGREPIFEGVSFNVEKGAKVGLVGTNGSGKSTLFKLLSKAEYPDDGWIEVTGEVENVLQEVKKDERMEKSETIREYLDPRKIKEDFELREILAGLELGSLKLEQSPHKLSGGQKTRLAIARALILEPDILLLDEPTNFLDKSGKVWVMNFLARYPKTLILVSHDLGLLDKNIDKVLAINNQTKKIEEYKGNYSEFVRQKAEYDALMKRKIAAQQKHLVQMKKGLLKMAHVKSEKGVRQRLNLERRIEKIEENLPEMPKEAMKIRLVLPEPSWVGSMPVWVKKVSKSFGPKRVLAEVSLDVMRGERIALVGPNGAGKSTLIKIIMGLISPDGGEVVKDNKLNAGYYSQEFEDFDLNKTMMETMREKCDMGEAAVRSMMGRFLFTGERVYQRVGTLSGGEKTRLAIAVLLAQNYNLLIFDEPTTYLDPMSQRVILEAIKEYKGAVLVVSHTPEFIEELKVSRKLYLPENRIELVKEKIVVPGKK